MRIGFLILLAAGGLAASAPASAAQRARPTCQLSLRAEPDSASFTTAVRNEVRPPAVAQAVGTLFAAAASHLCAARVVTAVNLRPYRRLLVRNAEGAAEPNIYDDAEEQPGALILEYAFAGGPAPTQAAIEAALRCWRNPNGAGCSTEDVGP